MSYLSLVAIAHVVVGFIQLGLQVYTLRLLHVQQFSPKHQTLHPSNSGLGFGGCSTVYTKYVETGSNGLD